MPIYELAALGAALCWTVSSLVSAGPSAHVGALRFNQTRMALVFLMLGVYVGFSGAWQDLVPDQYATIVLSGFIGIFLGDTALFLALNRLGPRRTGIMFAMNAPMAVLLGWLFLDEVLSARELVGILLVVGGVVLAIAFGKRRSQLHHWESIKGPLWVGIALGLAAALSQALGAIIIRPVMETGADAITVSWVRVGVAALSLTLLMQLPLTAFKPANKLNLSVTAAIALSGFLGMGLGMTLLLFALIGGEVGIVSTLSATAPALMLPILWIRTGERPAAGAWLGAALVIIGSGLIFAHP